MEDRWPARVGQVDLVRYSSHETRKFIQGALKSLVRAALRASLNELQGVVGFWVFRGYFLEVLSGRGVSFCGRLFWVVEYWVWKVSRTGTRKYCRTIRSMYRIRRCGNAPTFLPQTGPARNPGRFNRSHHRKDIGSPVLLGRRNDIGSLNCDNSGLWPKVWVADGQSQDAALPEVMRWTPSRLRMRVVLPQPDGPSSPVMEPRGSEQDRPWRISVRPRCTTRSETSMLNSADDDFITR